MKPQLLWEWMVYVILMLLGLLKSTYYILKLHATRYFLLVISMRARRKKWVWSETQQSNAVESAHPNGQHVPTWVQWGPLRAILFLWIWTIWTVKFVEYFMYLDLHTNFSIIQIEVFHPMSDVNLRFDKCCSHLTHLTCTHIDVSENKVSHDVGTAFLDIPHISWQTQTKMA